uniref:Uncharacterized protein n=1 Tax=Arundo donax TaxID=35708 RepID=A0A0A9FG92_ARUDO
MNDIRVAFPSFYSSTLARHDDVPETPPVQ